MVLQHDRVGEHAGHALRVAVAARHRQVQPEGVTVLDVHVARLAAAQRVHAPVERLIRLHQHFDLGVAALHRHYIEPTKSHGSL